MSVSTSVILKHTLMRYINHVEEYRTVHPVTPMFKTLCQYKHRSYTAIIYLLENLQQHPFYSITYMTDIPVHGYRQH